MEQLTSKEVPQRWPSGMWGPPIFWCTYQPSGFPSANSIIDSWKGPEWAGTLPLSCRQLVDMTLRGSRGGWHYGDKQFTPPHPASHSLTGKHSVLWDLESASYSCSSMAPTLPTASLGGCPLRSGWVLTFNSLCHSKTFGHTPEQGEFSTSRVIILEP